MSDLDLQKVLEESGAILRGHFLLTSGRHSDTYFEKFRVLEQPDVLSRLCTKLASGFPDGVDIVVGPTTGGIIVAFEVARQMGLPALYVESEDGQRKLRRGGTISKGSRFLVVDDVYTTGRSIREVISLLTEMGAVLAGVGVLIDRSVHAIDWGAPLIAAHRVSATSYAANELPDWLAAIPLTKPGTRIEK
ncbi:MAG: orotate phosphoribosyltransferase [Fimbriimonadaceae bacterium]